MAVKWADLFQKRIERINDKMEKVIIDRYSDTVLRFPSKHRVEDVIITIGIRRNYVRYGQDAKRTGSWIVHVLQSDFSYHLEFPPEATESITKAIAQASAECERRNEAERTKGVTTAR